MGFHFYLLLYFKVGGLFSILSNSIFFNNSTSNVQIRHMKLPKQRPSRTGVNNLPLHFTFFRSLSNELPFPSTKDNATYNLGMEYDVHAH